MKFLDNLQIKAHSIIALCLSLLIAFLLHGCADDEQQAKLTVTAIQPSKGSAGTTITITGAGFSKDVAQNSVKFSDGVML